MVVVQNGETTIGLLVDELIGMQEVVLKSLEKNFRSDPRPLGGEHPGRRPRLADPRPRRGDRHGRAAAGPCGEAVAERAER